MRMRHNRQTAARAERQQRGFTLTELMIAVVVLIIVLLATNKIFSTASKVTAIGQATTDIMQEAAAIERLIRADFASLAPEGFFAIRSVAVVNDINLPDGPLLNPILPKETIIRADQLVFFANSAESTQTFSIGNQNFHKGQAMVARVYYGQAFQLPEGDPFGGQPDRAHDPMNSLPLYPWFIEDVVAAPEGQVPMQWTKIARPGNIGPDEFSVTSGGVLDGRQPEARKWLLVRQPVILVDDDEQSASAWNKTLFFYDQFGDDAGNRASKSIWWSDPQITQWTPEVRNGRMDAAATMINDIRRHVLGHGDWGTVNGQRQFISLQGVYYPRAERAAPSSHPVDQALTNPVLAGACSSFIVEWTYDDLVGYPRDANGDILRDPNTGQPVGVGVDIDSRREQPWFGYSDMFVPPNQRRGVGTLTEYFNQFLGGYDETRHTIDPQAIEPYGLFPVPYLGGSRRYEAIFGFNQDEPLNLDTGAPWLQNSGVAYTPWPSAIRITMVLHDRDSKLERGREFQFVIDLPRRVE